LGIAPRFEIESVLFLLPWCAFDEHLLADQLTIFSQLFAKVVVSSVSAARCLSQQNAGSSSSKTAAAVRLRLRALWSSNVSYEAF
jgi:hypothetical protein